MWNEAKLGETRIFSILELKNDENKDRFAQKAHKINFLVFSSFWNRKNNENKAKSKEINRNDVKTVKKSAAAQSMLHG